jgi:hypothetical protein
MKACELIGCDNGWQNLFWKVVSSDKAVAFVMALNFNQTLEVLTRLLRGLIFTTLIGCIHSS